MEGVMNKKIVITKLVLLVLVIGTYIFAKMDEKVYKETNKKVAQENTVSLREFTLEDLKKYNGKNGMPVYVAVDGIVYDMTNVPVWASGRHKNLHSGGEELTEAYHNKAPKSIHKDRNILDKLPKVGVLVEKKSESIDTTTTATPKYEVTEYVVTPSDYGKVVTCPVMGTKFKVKKGTKAFKYKEKVYYLCCSGCEKSFVQNPEKYVK